MINEFVVPIGIDKAWTLLTDVATLSKCMPGAYITSIDDDEYLGTIKIKVGPITAEFEGKASFVEKDDNDHRAVIMAKGHDTKGSGQAKAIVTATLIAEGKNSTKIRYVTDVTISGRIASFGRGVVSDISNKLFSQFVTCVKKGLGV